MNKREHHRSRHRLRVRLEPGTIHSMTGDVTEMLLAGRSPGRMCLQLQVRASNGSRLPWSSRL